MPKKPPSRTWTTELLVDARDVVEGSISWNAESRGHVVVVALPTMTNGALQVEQVAFFGPKLSEGNVLSPAEQAAFFALWRKIRDHAAAERGFVQEG